MPQVPTLQPNVGLQVGNARLTPPSTNVEAYGYGSAGTALMGLGQAISDAAIAKQARINQAATLQARNNLQLALQENMRQQFERKGENALGKEATDTEEAVDSVSTAFGKFSSTALQDELGRLRNSTQRNELQQWFDQTYPTYYHQVATYENQQLDQWHKENCDGTVTLAGDMFSNAIMTGDWDTAKQAYFQAYAANDNYLSWSGTAGPQREAARTELMYNMMQSASKRLETEGRASEAQDFIDRALDEGFITDNQHKLLLEGIEQGIANNEADSIVDQIINNPNIYNADGSLNEANALQLADELTTKIQTTYSGGQAIAPIDGDDFISREMRAVGMHESKGDPRILDYLSTQKLERGENPDDPHVGLYQFSLPTWNGYVKQAEEEGLHIGRYVNTWQELADVPMAEQHAVARYAMEKLVKKFGENPDAIAVAWYRGEGVAEEWVQGASVGEAPLGQPTIAKYLQEFHAEYDPDTGKGVFGYQGGGTPTQTKVQNPQLLAAVQKKLNRRIKYEAERRSAQNTNALEALNQQLAAMRASGIIPDDNQVAQMTEQVCNQYGIQDATRRTSILNNALNIAGMGERMENHDYQKMVNQMYEDVYSNKFKTVADLQVAYPNLKAADLAKVKNLFNGSADSFKTNMKNGVTAALTQGGYQTNGVTAFYLNLYVSDKLNEYMKEHDGEMPPAENALIWAQQGLVMQPIGQYGGNLGFLGTGIGGSEGAVFSVPVALATHVHDDATWVQYRAQDGSTSWYAINDGRDGYAVFNWDRQNWDYTEAPPQEGGIRVSETKVNF